MKTKDEDRKIEDIPAAESNEFISEFIISVRTKDGNEYEPTSLRSLMASFERHLKKQGYSASIINDLVFEKTRKVLQSKQKQLKKQGKGNKPKASVALTSEKGLLGMCSPGALLNTLWLNSTLHFGLRGCKEHRDMCWGDVKLHKTWSSMKDKRKLELAQSTAMSELYRRKCLRPTKLKEILSRSTNFLPGKDPRK